MSVKTRLGRLEAREAARREALAREWEQLAEQAARGLSGAEVDALRNWSDRTDGEACKREVAELEAWEATRNGPSNELTPEMDRWLSDTLEGAGTPQLAPAGTAAALQEARDGWRAVSEAPDCPQPRAARYLAGLCAFSHEYVRVLGEVEA